MMACKVKSPDHHYILSQTDASWMNPWETYLNFIEDAKDFIWILSAEDGIWRFKTIYPGINVFYENRDEI